MRSQWLVRGIRQTRNGGWMHLGAGAGKCWWRALTKTVIQLGGSLIDFCCHVVWIDMRRGDQQRPKDGIEIEKETRTLDWGFD